jgi:3-oxoadipate enol-lactonase
VSEPVAVHHRLDGPGDAPVLVLGHSIGCDLGMWDPQMEALSARFRVLRYDHRGHGASPVPSGPYSLDDLGADVLALLDRLELERVHVGGLSLGGMVAMWIAARAPERVERLVLCCTSAFLGPRENWLERARTVRAEGMEAMAPTALERWLTPAFREREPATAAGLELTLLATAPEGYAACCEAIGGMDLRTELPGIAAPTLVVAGADDPATPPAHGEAIAAAIPGARLVVLPDAAHLANVEQPEALTRAVVEHLGAKDPKGGP